jgi:succinate dehydrogenase hydrophobic membrane anchor protein
MTKTRGFYRWFLQRLTGLLLAVFLITHTVVLHFSGNSPIDFKVVVARLTNSLWLLFYVLFLTNAIFHALNGVYGVIEDYNPSRTLKVSLSAILWVMGLLAVVWGIYVLMVFHSF